MKLLEPHLYLFTCNLKVRNYYFIILSIPHSPLPSVCACCQLINRWKWKNELNLIKEIFCTPISNQMEIRWVTRFSWIWRLIETKPFLDRKWRRKVKLCGLFAHFASKADIHAKKHGISCNPTFMSFVIYIFYCLNEEITTLIV